MWKQTQVQEVVEVQKSDHDCQVVLLGSFFKPQIYPTTLSLTLSNNAICLPLHMPRSHSLYMNIKVNLSDILRLDAGEADTAAERYPLHFLGPVLSKSCWISFFDTIFQHVIVFYDSDIVQVLWKAGGPGDVDHQQAGHPGCQAQDGAEQAKWGECKKVSILELWIILPLFLHIGLRWWSSSKEMTSTILAKSSICATKPSRSRIIW